MGSTSVPSSVTAESFYAKLGFNAVRDSYHGEERTIVMERRVPGVSRGPEGSSTATVIGF
jgi:hypothetical protein